MGPLYLKLRSIARGQDPHDPRRLPSVTGILDGKWAAKIPVEDQLFPVPVDHFRQQKKRTPREDL